jgi:CDP-paratose 2-epimerase
MSPPPCTTVSTPTRFGFVEWFRPGEYGRVERISQELAASGASYLRTHLSWAEYHAPGGQAWFDWLIPHLGRQFDLLPCVHYTPPSLSRTGRTSGAPRRLQDYPDFIDHVLTRHGEHFSHVELWNEPNNLLDWDWREDSDYQLFCEMIGAAAYWAQERGWKAVLGGPSPFDPVWLELMGERGVLSVVSAIGFHGFPGTWDSDAGAWRGWSGHLGAMRTIVDRYNRDAELWITEAGYSTWRSDEAVQVQRFLDAVEAPADRLYWYGWSDIPHAVAVQEGLWFDPRHYHLGVASADGRPKLLARLLSEGGIAKVREVAALSAPSLGRKALPVAIIGGSGFIGSNLAKSFLDDGEEVIVIDNLSRAGVETNLEWLRKTHPNLVHPEIADVRDLGALEPALEDAKAVFHLAAQTAVTTSLDQPIEDFDINARGTLNVLEAVRRAGRSAPVIFASTNKVYGNLQDLGMIELEDRYLPTDEALRAHGVDERRPLDFCTPYGCSKGVADQYVLDYGTSYGLPTAVLRMSCIYGPRQFGTEDQGWVAHFLIRAFAGKTVSVYGDGKQVRDVLHVADAVAAYRGVLRSIDSLGGQVFNLGGGPHNSVSLQVLLKEISRILGRDVVVEYGDWRKGDQLYFVADTRKLQKAIRWKPRMAWRDGLRDLVDWVRKQPPTAVSEKPRSNEREKRRLLA